MTSASMELAPQKSPEGVTCAVPFMKWAGGKSQLLGQMHPFFPTKFERYIEPFLGGGAVFFHLHPKKAILSDSNPDLVNAYQVVRDDPQTLMDELDHLTEYRLSQDRFYEVRGWDPSGLSHVRRAARTVFLNKTCFNGLYRVNSKGEFNVPWGGYKNPTLYDRGNVIAASSLLQGKSILLSDYRRACGIGREGDFVYLDPPYHPLSETSRFTSYTKEDFGEREQMELAETFRRLNKRGCLLMLSNSGTHLVRSLYEEFRIETLRARRAINSNGSGRGAVDELLIMNFEWSE
jgi:DNA adenine methylase